MLRRTLFALLFVLAGCSKGADDVKLVPPLTQLRIAVVQPGKDCAADATDWPAQQREYVKHLADRLEIAVQICPMTNLAEAAKALTEKRAEIALLDPPSYAPHKASLRPILTPRTPVDLGRTEVVLAVATESTLRKLEDVDRAALIFAGTSRPRLDGPRLTLSAAGLPQAVLAKARVLGSPSEVATALSSTPAAAGAFLSADWSRLCRGLSKEDHPCTKLREIWRGRPQAAKAWVVRRDIPPESWVRLVGIHVALFQEKPEIAKWLAPGTSEIEPTEATALDPARAGK
jgi:ABC-type phosphate/phosphonate transport system substrate-binding protein